jgi:hypothetical protein
MQQQAKMQVWINCAGHRPRNFAHTLSNGQSHGQHGEYIRCHLKDRMPPRVPVMREMLHNKPQKHLTMLLANETKNKHAHCQWKIPEAPKPQKLDIL